MAQSRGVAAVTPCAPRRVSDATPTAYGLTPGRYFINVARIAPEKRQLELVDAFQNCDLDNMALVFVGAKDHWPEYTRVVLAKAVDDKRIVFTGWQAGRELEELLAHSTAFVLPSSYEGLPLALLEARSLGTLCIASDIPGNREAGGDACHYFTSGDQVALAGMLRCAADIGPHARAPLGHIDQEVSWNHAVDAQTEAYHELMSSRGRRPLDPRRRHSGSRASKRPLAGNGPTIEERASTTRQAALRYQGAACHLATCDPSPREYPP